MNLLQNSCKPAALLALCLLTFANFAAAQTFNGTGGIIPDNANSVDFAISVSGLPTTIDTLNFGVETVCINVTHPYVSDLSFYLVAPDGTQVGLSLGNGSGGDDYTGTCFNHFAPTRIIQSSPPFTGTFKPQGQIGMVNNNQNPNGVWKIRAVDTYAADIGSLADWSLTFGTTPAPAYFIKQTNIPLVILKTNGQGISGNTKITAQMGIIDNGVGNINRVTDSFNVYNGFVGIEIRGSSSGSFPQKQYSIETRDSAGNNRNVSLLGMAADNDWILYAPYTDKSLMRNRLTYDLSNEMNRWAIKGRFCEVILNNEYQGIYELTENIKRGNNRLNIAKMTVSDTLGDALTGGYIVKIDRVAGPSWVSTFLPDQLNSFTNTINYQCIYPKPENIKPLQFEYIKRYVDSFETALAAPTFTDSLIGWRKYADEAAFIDYFLLNELTKNVDAYTLSTFFFKDKNSRGGKLQMGPNWDYNLAWHNSDYCTGDLAEGWIYRKSDVCQTDISFWWNRFMTDTKYKNNMQCRWIELRASVLDTAHIFGKMDSIAAYLNEAKDRHFQQWDILGRYIWPNPAPIANTYTEELYNTKQWIKTRLNWMDTNVPGICSPVSTEITSATDKFSVFPNPVTDVLSINIFDVQQNDLSATLYDALGRVVLVQNFKIINADNQTLLIDLKSIEKGFYFIKINNKNITLGMQKIVKI